MAIRSSAWTCPYNECSGDGWIVDEETDSAHDCRCRPEMQAELRLARVRRGMPPRHRQANIARPPFTHLPGKVQKPIRAFVSALTEKLAAGEGLWLEGPSGTGKTSAACAVANAAGTQRIPVSFYTAADLLDELKRTMNPDEYVDFTREQWFERLADLNLLIVDDIGMEYRTEWAAAELSKVIATRYDEQKSIIVTTNLPAVELRKVIGGRAVSRLGEMCGEAIAIDDVDHRFPPDHPLATIGVRRTHL